LSRRLEDVRSHGHEVDLGCEGLRNDRGAPMLEASATIG
jgi:hypothetical protein